MFESLKEKKARYDELQRLVSDPKVIQNNLVYQKYAKEMSRLSHIVGIYDEYLRLAAELEAVEGDLNDKTHDADYIELASDEGGIGISRRTRIAGKLLPLHGLGVQQVHTV